MDLRSLGEFGLISHLHAGLGTRAGVRLGIGDDAAVLDALACPLVTVDALVEGVHFRRDWTTPRALGRKAMAVNLSDLAASGARPVAAFVALALPSEVALEWVEELYRGLEDAACAFAFTVAGGDTTKSRDALLSIALIGDAMDAARGPVLRSGAQVGDELFVSGTLGDAAAGLAWLQNPGSAPDEAARRWVLQRHHEPTPRLELMRALLHCDAQGVRAALDLSDGLVGDAAHLARASGVSLEIEAQQLPLSPACRASAAALGAAALDWALSGGEDYELLLALSPASARALTTAAARSGTPLTRIGRCVAPDDGGPRVLVRENGAPRQSARAWTHF